MSSNADKWRYTLYTTVVFLIVVNPVVYRFMNNMLNGVVSLSNMDGCPTKEGILLHTIIFTVVIRLMMELNI